jgi:integrase
VSPRKPYRPLYVLSDAWEDALDVWLAWLRIGGASPNTLRLRRNHLRMVARELASENPSDITFAQLVAFCSERAWSLEYRRSMRSSLVGFFDWCVDNGLAVGNPAIRLPKIKQRGPNPRPTPDDVWNELLATAPPRELLMVRLAGEAGLRRAEIAKCHHDDLIRDPRGDELIVHGKGDKQRVVPISRSLADAIRAQCVGGYVFPAPTGGHLSTAWVGDSCSRLMPPGWTLHKLRHRFASRAYRGSRNLRAVQVLLGHASVATTERYTAVATDEIRAAMMSALP